MNLLTRECCWDDEMLCRRWFIEANASNVSVYGESLMQLYERVVELSHITFRLVDCRLLSFFSAFLAELCLHFDKFVFFFFVSCWKFSCLISYNSYFLFEFFIHFVSLELWGQRALYRLLVWVPGFRYGYLIEYRVLDIMHAGLLLGY